MCLILLAINQHPDYPFIVAANRDERYLRKSKAMHWWNDQAILAGQDVEAGGSWLGLTPTGRFAALTNYREVNGPQGLKSRGHLVKLWLSRDINADALINEINPAEYAGFNLLFGDIKTRQLMHLSNRHPHCTPLADGFHGLSNALLNSDWPKIQTAIPEMQQLCRQPFHAEEWLALLASRQLAEEDALPQTGISLEAERALSARFIQGTDYGTRASTVIALHRSGTIAVIEKSFNAQGNAVGQRQFQWQLQP